MSKIQETFNGKGRKLFESEKPLVDVFNVKYSVNERSLPVADDREKFVAWVHERYHDPHYVLRDINSYTWDAWQAGRAALSAPQPVTCQIYGHIVGHCAECNVGEEAPQPSQCETEFAKWIVENPAKYHKDWACAECAPESDILVTGFQCIPHKAKSLLAAPSPKEPT
jgi:hypothetical protein